MFQLKMLEKHRSQPVAICFSRETGLFCHGLFHNGNYVFEGVFGL